MVACLTYLTGISVQTAFHIITAGCFISSLILLSHLLKKYAGSGLYQFGIVVALGSQLAVFYGLHPVLVDGVLLLLTCLMIVAIQKEKLVLSFIFVCLAALTKEYGVLLALPWAIFAYRKGVRRVYIFAFAFLPLILVLIAILSLPVQAGVYYGYEDYVVTQLKYQAIWLQTDNFYYYFKLAYFQAWGAVWPVLLMSILVVYRKYKDRTSFTKDEQLFSIMLLSLPILLTADWNRTLLLLIPFAIIVAGSLSALRFSFVIPLALGGFSTALARSYYYVILHGGTFPRLYKPFLLTLSIGSSIFLIIILVWEVLRSHQRNLLQDELR
jgi:hypothetical protein